MDYCDYKLGVWIIEIDVRGILVYVKEKLIDKYDVNNNGLFKVEIVEMLLIVWLVVWLVCMMKED